jgi:hypothetical protein
MVILSLLCKKLVSREESFAAPGWVKRGGQEGVPKDQREGG